jgi:copper(I)-binding protein
MTLALLTGTLALPTANAADSDDASAPQNEAIVNEAITDAADTAATPASIEIQNGYVRAVPPGQQNSAAFMTLINQGEDSIALLAGESTAAEVVELHTHLMEDGMMRMRQVEQIEVPAGKTVELKPGGLHVMLIGLTSPLKPGDTIDLNLGFDDGSQQSLTLPVKRIEPHGGGMQHH